MKTKRMAGIVLAFALAAVSQAAEPRVVFYLSFDKDIKACTPETEILPTEGLDVVDDLSMNVTMEELARGPKQDKIEGEIVSLIGGDRAQLVEGLVGHAVRLRWAITYAAPWLKSQPAGTIVLWYRHPVWKVQPDRVPAMLTPGAITPVTSKNVAQWELDRLTAPPLGTWLEDKTPEGLCHQLTPPATPDDQWRFWALRWDRAEGLIQVMDDTRVRGATIKPDFDKMFLGELHLARHCEVTIDEVYVWDQALPLADLQAAYARGREGKSLWPSATHPVPKHRFDEGLDLTVLATNRPALPKEVVWDDEGATIFQTETQRSTCLNGYWRFQPAKSRLEPPDPKTWYYVRLPGSWAKGGQRVFKADFSLLQTLSLMDEKPQEPLDTYPAFWFERDIEIASAQTGHRFFFRYDRFEDPLTVMDLYVNGRFVRTIRTYGPGRTDITEHMRPGAQNRISFCLEGKTGLALDMYLDARKEARVSTHDLYVIPSWRKKTVSVQFELENHTDQAQACRVEAEFFDWKTGAHAHTIKGLQPISVRARQALLTRIEGAWDNPRGWSIYDPFLYTAQLIVRDSKGTMIDKSLPVRFGFREIWSENGWLMVNGSKLYIRGMGHGHGYAHDNYGDSAWGGWNEERGLLFHRQYNNYWMRGLSACHAQEALDAYDEIGGVYTIILHGTGYDEKSLYRANPKGISQAIGLVTWLRNHPSLFSYICRQNLPARFYNDRETDFGDKMPEKYPELWAEWCGYWRAYTEPIRQHHPTALFHNFWLPNGDMYSLGSKQSYGISLQSREELPRLGIYGVGAVLTPPPASSREEFPKLGAYQGPAKFSAEEGFPQISGSLWDIAFDAGLGWGGGRGDRWPYKTQIVEELCAMYFGDEAYDTEAETGHFGSVYKMPPDGKARFNWDYVKNIECVGRPYSRLFTGPWVSPALFKLRSLWNERNIIAWRWYGFGYWQHTEHNQYVETDPRTVAFKDEAFGKAHARDGLRRPGLFLDDGDEARCRYQIDRATFRQHLPLTELGKIVEKAQWPVVAWVMGWPDVTQKDHAYFEDETIRKQIGVMNEYPWPVEPVVQWTVRNLTTNDEVRKGELRVAFRTGDQQLHPLELDTPKTGKKERYRIELKTFLDNKEVHGHSFEIQTFPVRKPEKVPSRRIALMDSGGTGAMLERAGVGFDPVDGKTDLSRYELLIIGRRSDPKAVRELLTRLDIHRHIQAGLNLLFFEQEGEVLERPTPDPWPALTLPVWTDRPELVSYGLRQDRRSSRYVFIRNPNHPLFEGLANEDMAHWRGESNLIEPWKPEYWNKGPASFRRRRYPNLSNLGDVATYVFEKPQGGNFVSLLDAEFDLLYTALLEERRGKGKVIFCQLNVTNRYGVDPVATLLVDRLVAYALRQEQGPEGKAALLANRTWGKVLEHLPFAFERVTAESSASVLSDMALLAVGLGQPRIEDFDDENRFIGSDAEPVVGEDPKVKAKAKEKKELDDAIGQTMEALTAPGAAVGVGESVLEAPTDKKAEAAKRVESGKGKEPPGPDLAYTWLTKHKGEIEEFVKQGGIVLVLPVVSAKDLAWLPFGVKMAKTKVYAVAPKGFLKKTSAIGPADLYWHRALELELPSGLPENSLSTEPAVLARVPWGKGEFILCQVHPKLIYGNWAESKLTRVLSAVLTEADIRDRFDLDLTRQGYQEGAFPYFGCTLYFDPFYSTSW